TTDLTHHGHPRLPPGAAVRHRIPAVNGGMMRRFMSAALIGLAVASASTVAAAQSRGGGAQAGRAGLRGAPFDSARARRIDSLRTARGDTAWRRTNSDSTRARGGRGRGGPPGMACAALAGLNLTASQKNDIKAINKKY